MKKVGVINSRIAAAIAGMGHNDSLAIVDAGYPIPTSTEKIDLALEPGVPGFLQTLSVVLSELFVERIILADEIKQHSPLMLKGIQSLLPDVHTQFVPHTEFKQQVPGTRAVIRTAEYTPYSNVILIAGAWGFEL